jgi:hypothetical protein
LGDKIAAEHLYTLQELVWRYTAVHFRDGAEMPFPQRIPYPGAPTRADVEMKRGWETATIDDLVSPEVRALLQGKPIPTRGGAPSRN